MGEVIVLYRILPDSPEAADEVKAALEGLKPDKLEEEPIAFGLKAFKITKFIPETANAEEEFEAKLKGLPHVQTVEMIMATRSL